MGHTPQIDGKIHPRFGDRVYLIDTAMAYPELGGRAAALEIDGDRVTAVYTDAARALHGWRDPRRNRRRQLPEQIERAYRVEGTNGHSQEEARSNPPTGRKSRRPR